MLPVLENVWRCVELKRRATNVQLSCFALLGLASVPRLIHMHALMMVRRVEMSAISTEWLECMANATATLKAPLFFPRSNLRSRYANRRSALSMNTCVAHMPAGKPYPSRLQPRIKSQYQLCHVEVWTLQCVRRTTPTSLPFRHIVFHSFPDMKLTQCHTKLPTSLEAGHVHYVYFTTLRTEIALKVQFCI